MWTRALKLDFALEKLNLQVCSSRCPSFPSKHPARPSTACTLGPGGCRQPTGVTQMPRCPYSFGTPPTHLWPSVFHEARSWSSPTSCPKVWCTERKAWAVFRHRAQSLMILHTGPRVSWQLCGLGTKRLLVRKELEHQKSFTCSCERINILK